MVRAARSRVSLFMSPFRRAGFIKYRGGIYVHKSLLRVISLDQLPKATQPAAFLPAPPPKKVHRSDRSDKLGRLRKCAFATDRRDEPDWIPLTWGNRARGKAPGHDSEIVTHRRYGLGYAEWRAISPHRRQRETPNIRHCFSRRTRRTIEKATARRFAADGVMLRLRGYGGNGGGNLCADQLAET